MQITPLGQVIVRNTTKRKMCWSCSFGRRWVDITIHPNGLVCFDNAKLSTKIWALQPEQRARLRSHLANMLVAERQYSSWGF
jgi:hypothetical protein